MNAHEFYNLVVLMRANQKCFFKLNKKKNKTAEEVAECKKYLENSVAFEKQVDDEISRVQAIMDRRAANEQ